MNVFKLSSGWKFVSKERKSSELSKENKLFGKQEFAQLMKKSLGVPVQLYHL